MEITMENSNLTFWATSEIFVKAARNKQSSNGRKFAQTLVTLMMSAKIWTE
jgi:hypothetical protein